MDIDAIQHINVKVLANGATTFDLKRVIPVFHRWIQDTVLADALAIDVADYRHVPDGPGVILVAHEAIYALDQGDGRLGLLYDRRATLDGSPHDRMRQAAEAALMACHLLEEEPTLGSDLHFDAGRLEISVNDRALAPNDEATEAALRPHATALLQRLWGPGEYQLARVGAPRERFRFAAEAGKPLAVAEALNTLS